MQTLINMYDLIKSTQHGSKLLGDMENSETNYTIEVTMRSNIYNYNSINNTITISLMKTKWQGCTKNGWMYVTPLRALAHEIGHSVTQNEDQNVLSNENPIVRALGLPERTGYEPTRYFGRNLFDYFGPEEGGKCGC